jgi:serine/threonine protein kinase
MKYLRGGSLATVLAERKKLTPPEIRPLADRGGSALGDAAQRGIVHRDIKPDNIMFDEFGQCVLTDFGIAKAASGGRLTGTGMSIGTPHYMSPEQARAQPIDGRSDIYSLGVVAYQCLAGVVRTTERTAFRSATSTSPSRSRCPTSRLPTSAGVRSDQADVDEGTRGSVSGLRGADRLAPGPATGGPGSFKAAQPAGPPHRPQSRASQPPPSILPRSSGERAPDPSAALPTGLRSCGRARAVRSCGFFCW